MTVVLPGFRVAPGTRLPAARRRASAPEMGPSSSSTTRWDTGSVARAPLPKKTNGVEPEAFDQSLPFHSHVTALGEIEVLQAGSHPPRGAAGVGAIAGSGCTGGTTGVVDAPRNPTTPIRSLPEQAIGPVDPVTCRRPTRSTSRLIGS